MTLVYTPPPGHRCDIGWETRVLGPDAPSVKAGFATAGVRYAVMAHCNDAPGTVRRCGTCGKHWVAERHRPGSVMIGVFWRPEKRRERRRRERAAGG